MQHTLYFSFRIPSISAILWLLLKPQATTFEECFNKTWYDGLTDSGNGLERNQQGRLHYVRYFSALAEEEQLDVHWHSAIFTFAYTFHIGLLG